MPVVSQVVNLLDDNFKLVTLLPGDVIPDWAVDRISNPAVLATEPPRVEPATVDNPVVDPVEPVDYSTLKKDELIKLANDRGIDSSGNKPEIAARLAEADKAAEDEAPIDVFSLSFDELKTLAAERGVDVSAATTDIEAATILQSAE